MSIIHSIFTRLRSISAKHAVVAGVFTLAMAGAATFGLANREQAEAFNFTRDASGNAMVHRGAANAQELVNKFNNNSLPNNQGYQYRTEAANFHKDFKLLRSEYGSFAKEALQCWAYRSDNTVKCTINGKEETVLTNAWSIGRWQKNKSWVHKIDGKNYYADYNRDVFSSAKLPVLVYFNKKGEVRYAALNACGNQMAGKKIKVTGKCERLTKKEVGLNKYEFTTKASASRLGKVVKVEYLLDGKKIGQSTNSGNSFRFTHTFTKSGEVSAKVHIKVPGGHIIHVTDKCKTKITFKKPFYECKQLKSAIRDADAEYTTYRFTAVNHQGNGATLKNADFILNGQTAATNVTSKDGNGNIYRDIKVENGKTHTVEAKIKFTVNGKTVEAKEPCETTVSPKKPFYACDLLRPEALNDELTNFRFTVIASYGNGAELNNADFAVWKVSNPQDVTVVEGVDTRDEDGNIYREFEFAEDGETRIIEATVHFNVAGDVHSVKCQAEVTPKEAPKCPVPGKEHLPPNHPDCEQPEQPEEPKEEVKAAKELPVTGAGAIAGIFFSTTGAGAAIHRIVSRRLQ